MVSNGALSIAAALSRRMECRFGRWENHDAHKLYIPATMVFFSKGGRQAGKGALQNVREGGFASISQASVRGSSLSPELLLRLLEVSKKRAPKNDCTGYQRVQ